MKKTLILSIAFSLLFAASGVCKTIEPDTPPTPTFSEGERATVIDVSEFKKFKDRVRVISAVDGSKNFTIHIFRAKKNAWEYFGTSKIKGFGDTAFTDNEEDAKKCRWIAITPVGGGDFAYSPVASGTDVFITVLPKKSLIDDAAKEKATIFDIETVEGNTFKDDVEVNNTSSNPNASFAVFCFNDKSEDWIKIGDASFYEGKTNTTIYAPYDFSIAGFKYYAIVPKDGKSYNFSAVKSKKNLVITAF